MRQLAIGLVLAASTVSPVEASSCFIAVATTTVDVPIGCPVELVVSTDLTDVRVMALRGGVEVDVTGAITELGTTDLDVHYVAMNEPCSPDFDNRIPTPFDTISIELTGAQVGDTLMLAPYSWSLGSVLASGACPAVAPPTELVCDVSQPCFPEEPPPDDDDDPGDPPDGDAGGCSTGSGAGLLVGLLALRRRRSRTGGLR